MRIVLPGLVDNFGVVVRIVFILAAILFCMFGMPGFEDADSISLPITWAVVAGCLFCLVSFAATGLTSSSPMSMFISILASSIGYLYLVCGSYYAQFFGPFSKAVPVFVWIFSSLLPFIGTREFDGFVDDTVSSLATLDDGSIAKFLNYYSDHFPECWVQCHLFAFTVNLLRCTLYVSG